MFPPTVLVIPARWNSTRFPGKPLAILGGEPVIVHVARAGLHAAIDRPILVATDDTRIADAVGAVFETDEVEVVLTGECRTGTDRISQAVSTRFGAQTDLIVVNVQGDEPFVSADHIEALAEAMRDEPDLQMATLATPLPDAQMFHNPNFVKVVVRPDGRALYFSRAPIPHNRDNNGVPPLRHFGLYAYRSAWLHRMAALPSTPLEDLEKLEQLRALEHGIDIKVLCVSDVIDIAIDTPHDLERAQKYFDEHLKR